MHAHTHPLVQTCAPLSMQTSIYAHHTERHMTHNRTQRSTTTTATETCLAYLSGVWDIDLNWDSAGWARPVPLNADRGGSVDLSQACLAQFSEQCVQIGVSCPSKSSTGRSRCPDANEQHACQLHVIISPSRRIQKIPFLPKQPPWTSQRKGSHCIQLQNVEILEI